MSRKSTTSSEQISRPNTSFESANSNISSSPSQKLVSMDQNTGKIDKTTSSTSTITTTTCVLTNESDPSSTNNEECIDNVDETYSVGLNLVDPCQQLAIDQQCFPIGISCNSGLLKTPSTFENNAAMPETLKGQLYSYSNNNECLPILFEENSCMLKKQDNNALNTQLEYINENVAQNKTQPTKTFESLSSLSSSLLQPKTYSMTTSHQFELFTTTTKTSFNDNNTINVINHSMCEDNLSSQIATKDTKINDNVESDFNNFKYKFCEVCDRKLSITSFKCKCGYFFCEKHRHAESHNCNFDYKGEKKDYLRKNITSILADKVRKI